MSRHKLRKANAALNKGQMVRLVNERVVYVPPPIGRCCRFTEAGVLVGCSEVTEEECGCLQGPPTYDDCSFAEWSEDLNCTDNPCTEDSGACCVDGACSEQTISDCIALGGILLGINEPCPNCTDCTTPEDCCPTGRCCYGDSCAEGIRECECADSGGEWEQDGVCPDCTLCENESGPCCAEVEGICCKNRSCLGVKTRCECKATGGIFLAGQTECPDCDAGGNAECCPEPKTGACCNPLTFECTEESEGNCPEGSDFYPDQGCADIDCTAPPPKGTCCCACQEADVLVFGEYTGQVTETVCRSQGCRWSEVVNECDECPEAPGPPPPEPLGRCCSANGICSITTQANCGGQWAGAGTNCGTQNPCIQPPGQCLCECYTDASGNVTSVRCTGQPPTGFNASCTVTVPGQCAGGGCLTIITIPGYCRPLGP